MSEIGVKRFLRALGNTLQIRDVKQAPSRLETNDVKVTAPIDLGMVGAAQVQLVGSGELNNLSVWNWQAIGNDGGFTTPVALNNSIACWRENAESEAVILNLFIRIRFDPPVLPAHNGRIMRITEYRQAEGNPVSVIPGSVVDMTVNLTEWDYLFTFPIWNQMRWTGAAPQAPSPGPMMAASPIYVPAGSRWGLSCEYWETDMSTLVAWPFATIVQVHAVLVNCPRGMRPPGI